MYKKKKLTHPQTLWESHLEGKKFNGELFCQTPHGWPISEVRNMAEFLTISGHNSTHRAFAPCVSFLFKYNFINSYLLQTEKSPFAFLLSLNNCINNHAIHRVLLCIPRWLFGIQQCACINGHDSLLIVRTIHTFVRAVFACKTTI